MADKRDIFILDCPEIKCPLVLIFVFKELCGYFERNGYNVRIIHSLKEITNNSIVFMGDGFHVNNPVQLLKEQAPEAIYIGWYWNNFDTSELKYFIYTYENLIGYENMEFHNNRFNLIKDKKNRCPLLLRANEAPEMIGKYERNVEMDYCYMGHPYRHYLVPGQPFKGLYYAKSNWSEYLSYDERRQNYLKSMFSLGFQADENIKVKHVSQRIFEGIAYGCITFSESIYAVEQTEGIVQHITSKEDLEQKMAYFKNNPDALKELQEKGYEFICRMGTNAYTIGMYKSVIKECFNIEI